MSYEINPIEATCSECRKLINDLVDHRMTYDCKLQFMQRIVRCRDVKGCYICIDLVKSFFSIRKELMNIKKNDPAPGWLMNKILEKIQ